MLIYRNVDCTSLLILVIVYHHFVSKCTEWQIQDFTDMGAANPKKINDIGTKGGARVPSAPLGSANGSHFSYTSEHISFSKISPL